MSSDAGQQTNVSDQHPDVMARLTAFYDDWWAELEPTFQQDCALYVGHPADNPARLTCHDWITTGTTPWNQASVRNAMTGEANTGFWNINVVSDGEYEIRLQRWPEESGKAIGAALPPGAPVPGVQAYRVRPGKKFAAVKAVLNIGDQEWESPVDATQPAVTFKARLKAGVTRLSGRFYSGNGRWIGTYYAYVRKL